MRRHATLSLLTLALVSAAAAAGPRPLSFEDRVEAQRAIERVWWSHRIWPEQNPSPKPPLEAVMSEATLRAKVDDVLRGSRALEERWHRVITHDDLQRELGRMASHSRAPEVLREVFDALGNDPAVIAETLVRGAIVEREIRERYAHDAEIHAATRARAEAALAGKRDIAELRGLADAYLEQSWSLARRPGREARAERAEADVALDREDWDRLGRRLADAAGGAESRLHAPSRLVEDDVSFYTVAVLERGEGRIVVATAAWPKQSFESWWSSAKSAYPAELAAPAGEFAAAPPASPDASLGNCTADDTWSGMSFRRDVPSARYRQSAVWTGTEMIVWGGTDDVSVFADGSRYNPATDQWNAVGAEGAPGARYGHTAVWTGSRMVVWGGYDGATVVNTGGRYDPVSNTWQSTSTASAPQGRYYHVAVFTGSQMIVWGGDGSGGFVNDGGRYDPVADSWQPTTSVNAPAGRDNATAVWTGSVMVVWGGGGGVGHNDGGRYDPVADSWQPTTLTNAPGGRTDHTAVWTGSRMIVWGGLTGLSTALAGGAAYDPVGDAWSAINTTNQPQARYSHSAVWDGTDNKMIVWGGHTGAGFDLNDGGMLAGSGGGGPWAATSLTNAPVTRGDEATVWTGSQMVVWGGKEQSLVLNNGGRFDPVANAWSPTSTASGVSNAPAAREYATGVWSGTEFIVWGGDDLFNFLNTGGRYNPATDTWTPTNAGTAPTPREFHTAIWSGTEMIVWGGRTTGNAELNDGGRYNPATDVWTGIGNKVATPRERHTAVWASSQMLVFGGANGTTALGDGWRYNPSTDTWTAMGMTGTPPSARWWHNAVFVQEALPLHSYMVVWGGMDGVNPAFNDGGRYDTLADTWLGLSTAGAPSGRAKASAVVDGSRRMLVWGGGSNTGGLYDASLDSWTSMTTAGAPEQRVDNVVGWTGAEMVVWGGSDGAAVLDSGGRYNPSGDVWRPMTTATAPTARYVAAGAGTSGFLTVWGGAGAGGGVVLNSGGRYCSCPAYFRDYDGDGYGDPTVSVTVCSGGAPAGYVANDTDCNDGNPSIHPGAADTTCDGLDNDCSGTVDDGVPWTATNNSGAPVARHDATAVWTGTEMIVWGGLQGTTALATGARYNPATDSWAALPAGPTARSAHTAVWTGTKMVVWGGKSGTTDFATGSRYDPAANTWAATTGTGVPGARSQHTAVWTGTEMIVWGGYAQGTARALSDGKRYDPVADTWTTLASAGITARYAHAAVFGAGKMMIWGGIGATNYPTDGSTYDTGSQTWTAMPTAPITARQNPGAVWSGTQMIVWGGQQSSSPITGGARFDPVANAWTGMTHGEPTARWGHAAVWTGLEMFVWGGEIGPGQPLTNGALYNPAKNVWRNASALSQPSFRYGLVAAWSGSEMIVWGGTDGTRDTATGGRICAPLPLSAAEVSPAAVLFGDKHTLSWGGSTAVSSYDLYRGSVTSPWTWNHTCIASGFPTPTFPVPDDPGTGLGFYYLVSGRNVDSETSLGSDSTGTPRPNSSPCP